MATSTVFLHHLAAEGVDVTLCCNGCGHSTIAPTHGLLVRFGTGCSLDHIARHMRCTRCGSRDVVVRPDWCLDPRRFGRM